MGNHADYGYTITSIVVCVLTEAGDIGWVVTRSPLPLQKVNSFVNYQCQCRPTRDIVYPGRVAIGRPTNDPRICDLCTGLYRFGQDTIYSSPDPKCYHCYFV